jgi:hypothetical protein
MSVPPEWGALYHEVGELTAEATPFEWHFNEDTAVVDNSGNPGEVVIDKKAGYAGFTGYYNLPAVTNLFANGGARLGMLVLPNETNNHWSINYSQEKNLGFGDFYVVHYDGAAVREFHELFNPCDQRLSVAPFSSNLDWLTTYRLYIGNSKPFNRLNFKLGSVVNAVASDLSAQYWDGHDWQTMTIAVDGTVVAATKTMSGSGEVQITMPGDWEPGLENDTGGDEEDWADGANQAPTNIFWARFAVSVNLTADIDLVEIWGYSTTGYESVSLGSMTAPVHSWITLDLDNQSKEGLRCLSIAMSCATVSARKLTIKRGIKILNETRPNFIYESDGGRVLSLVAYGDEAANPWVITEDRVFEIDIQNNDAIKEIPLSELRQLASSENGRVFGTSDVYLLFNLRENLERYYNRSLEDIGPNRDEGLPVGRSGIPVGLVSFPGEFYVGINGKNYDPLSTASPPYIEGSIMLRKSGWHEFYRLPPQMRLWNIYGQSLPDTNNRMWGAAATDIFSLPAPTNSKATYYCAPLCEVVTGWVDYGMSNVSKLFSKFGVYSEKSGTGDTEIRVEYQLETGDINGAWTYLIDWDNQSGYTEYSFANNVTGKRIRFRITAHVSEGNIQLFVRSWLLETIIRFEVKYSYRMLVNLGDFPTQLWGAQVPATRVEDLQTRLDSWASPPPKVLTFRCQYTPFDNKRVIIDAVPMKPITVTVRGADGKPKEVHYGEVTLLEI